ncbi:hypothetical protein [Paracoccus beibuensis]|uniref:hypothetical protein n=1 Tax=Paracoccus beibuensis TaxID=547602 RepID=UPI002240121B|nr:hypothetical protein [Paracoccus beibuensis]
MLLARSLAKPASQYLGGKLRGILWPFLVWSTSYVLVTGTEPTNLHYLQKVYTGGSHLWFLGFIFVYYLVAKTLESVDPLLVAVTAFLLSILSADGAKYSERLFFLMALFFLGTSAARCPDVLARTLASRWI